MLRKSALNISAALLLATGMVFPAAAETMSSAQMQRQIEALTAQVEQLSSMLEKQNEVIQRLSGRYEEQDAKLMEQEEMLSKQSAAVENLAAIAPAAGGEGSNVKVSMKPMPKIESADGTYSFQPFGRVHLDLTHFWDDRRDHPDNANFRRARLGFKGNLGEDFSYKSEIDFAGQNVAFRDVYLSYTGMDFADMTIGHIKPPFGMQQNTSSNYLQLIERSGPTNAFTRGHLIGALLNGGGENWSLGGGIFNEHAGSTSNNDDEAWSLDGRGTIRLYHDADTVIHAGIGGSYQEPNRGTQSVTLSARPSGRGNNMVTTGAIANVENATAYGGELALVKGPFSAQGEYILYNVDRNGAADPDFDGWYAQAGYFLTGESRPYSAKSGTFGRVKPKTPFSLNSGGWGAFEIAGRYEVLDLNDVGGGVTGGEMKNWTVGLNWHLTDYIRMMANYVSVNTDSNAVIADDDPELLAIRAQWDF